MPEPWVCAWLTTKSSQVDGAFTVFHPIDPARQANRRGHTFGSSASVLPAEPLVVREPRPTKFGPSPGFEDEDDDEYDSFRPLPAGIPAVDDEIATGEIAAGIRG
jgi:hypothetical protein